MNQQLSATVPDIYDNNYIVSDEGNYSQYEYSYIPSVTNYYRLYRFLTDLEDTISNYENEQEIIKILMPKVRQLLTESDWIQLEYIEPNPSIGWSVKMLYDEPNFPLTVQIVTWLPGQKSPIHNHGTWGIVAILSGEEKNTFWRKYSTEKSDNAVKSVGERILEAGDIIAFTSNAIHQVEVISDEPVISFNVYGITDFNSRFEFDFINQTAKNF